VSEYLLNPTRKRCNKKTVLFIFSLSVLIFVGLGFYGIFVEPYQVEIRHVWIEDSKLGKVLDQKTVVHLSDLHISKIGKRERRVLEILDDLQPDFVFFTGDYVSWRGDYEFALNFFSRIKARIGAWAVMGDYDYSYSRKSCLFCHEQGSVNPTERHQVKFLRNRLEKIDLPRASLWIGGIDHNADRVFASKQITKSWIGKEPAIILSHNPVIFEELDQNCNVLMLSGDTHGGQVPLPSWLWSVLGYKKNAKYSQGLFEKGRKKMFVSRGVGTSHVPVRIGRRPEVVVLHFE